MTQHRALLFSVLAGGALLVACSGEAPGAGGEHTQASAPTSDAPETLTYVAPIGAVDDAFVDGAHVEHSGRVHVLPMRTAAAPTNEATAVTPAATTPHLNYYGGKVLSKVKVVEVLYGSGTYMSNIAGTASPTLASFYTQVTNSKYFDWLTEYNTSTQTIGRGSFLSKVQITPATSHNGSTISDASIQAELSAQMTAGTLPAPDANTIYMVSFPKGKRITQGGSSSCVQFCAYHGTFKRNSQEVFYGVLPDMSSGSGCDGGCGGSTWYNNQTSVASHELIEAVTDAEVGLATVVGSPLAWYDPKNGEIGDICNGSQGTIVGGDGVTYTVQKEWSNSSKACIVSR